MSRAALPEVVNQLADVALDAGVSTLDQELNKIQTGVTP